MRSPHTELLRIQHRMHPWPRVLLRIKTNSITRDAYPSRHLSYSPRIISLDKANYRYERVRRININYIKHPRRGNRNGKYSSGHWPLPRLVATRLSELRTDTIVEITSIFSAPATQPLCLSLSPRLNTHSVVQRAQEGEREETFLSLNPSIKT